MGFADLLDQVQIGELWATPRLWREYDDPMAAAPCEDAVAFRDESERRVAATMCGRGRRAASPPAVTAFL